jgi:hypothetical protein
MWKKLIILCVAMLSVTSMAEAYTQPALNYHATDPSDPASCYTWYPINQSGVGLTRVCSGTFSVDFPLSFDISGNWQVDLYVKRPATTSQLSCQVWTVTSSGGYLPGTVVDFKGPVIPNFAVMHLPRVNVADSATGFVRCLMAKGTSVLEIDAYSTF